MAVPTPGKREDIQSGFSIPSLPNLINKVGEEAKAAFPQATNEDITKAISTKFFKPAPQKNEPFPIKPIEDMRTVVSDALSKGGFWDAIWSPFTAVSKEFGGFVAGESAKPIEERKTTAEAIAEKLHPLGAIASQADIPVVGGLVASPEEIIQRSELPTKLPQYQSMPESTVATAPSIGPKLSVGAQIRAAKDSFLTKVAPFIGGLAAENLLFPNPERDVKLAADGVDTLKGVAKVEKIMKATAPDAIPFVLNSDAPGAAINDLGLPELKGIGKRARIWHVSDVNGRSVQTDFVANTIQQEAGLADEIDQRAAFYYQSFFGHPEEANKMRELLNSGDKSLDFVPPGKKEPIKVPIKRALDALANDQGGTVPKAAAPVTPAAPVGKRTPPRLPLTNTELQSLSYPELVKTPEYADWEKRYMDISKSVYSKEKSEAEIPWSAESRKYYDAGDWKAFSKSRGYTDAQIKEFQQYLDTVKEAETRFGMTSGEVQSLDVHGPMAEPGGAPTLTTGKPIVETVPSHVVDNIYNNFIENSKITGADILSQEDIAGFKAAAKEAETAQATQITGLAPEELFAGEEGGVAPVGTAEYAPKAGPAIPLTPAQEAELKKIKESGKFSDADIEEFKNTMMGKPLVLTAKRATGEGAGMRGVGESGRAAVRDIAAERTSVPLSIPRTPEDIAQKMVTESLVRAVAKKFNLTDAEISTITDELTADVKRAGTKRASAPARRLATFFKSYFPGEGDLQAKLSPLVEALQNEDIASISKFAAQPNMPKEKFAELVQNFDNSKTRDKGALANAIIETFNPPKVGGNNNIVTARTFLESIGYPGGEKALDNMLVDIKGGIEKAVKEEVVAPAGASGLADVRPSKFFQGKKMMDTYYMQRAQEGKALGYVKNELESYINRMSFRPEETGVDVFDLSIPEPKEAKITGAGGLSRRTQYGQGRVYKTPYDAIVEGVFPREDNALTLMKDYGYKDARAHATTQMIATFKSGDVAGWYNPSEVPENWTSLSKYGKTFENNIAIIDKEGKPQVVSRVLAVPNKIGDMLKPILKNYDKPEVLSKWRNLQSFVKYIDLSLSLFHAKALSLVALWSMGPKQMANAFKMDMASPDFMNTELEFLFHSGITPEVDKKMQNFIKLRFGEEAGGEAFRADKLSQIPLIGKPLSALENSSLMRAYNATAEKTTGFTFDVIQRRYKVQDYAQRVASWMAKNPEATTKQLDAFKTEAASLVNGFYGGLNWQALGVSKGQVEILRTFLLAPDWTISNLIPTARAALGRPGYLSEVSGGNKIDAESLKFLVQSVLGGAMLTQMTNIALNGRPSSDWTNVTMGIDQNGKEIKANLFFAGDTRDIINLVNQFKDKGITGIYSFLEGKAAPGFKQALEVATNKDPLGNDITQPYDSWIEKMTGAGWYAMKDFLPKPIALSNPIGNYLTYKDKGGVTLPEEIISGLGLGYISHKHATSMLENNFFDSRDAITQKYKLKNGLTAKETAIMNNMKTLGSQITELRNLRKEIGASNAPFSEKYDQINKIDSALSLLLSRSLNPTDSDLEQAASDLQMAEEDKAMQEQMDAYQSQQ